MKTTLTLGCVAALSDKNLENHLLPLLELDEVSALHLLRAAAPVSLQQHPKVVVHILPRWKPLRFSEAFWRARHLERKAGIDAWISFNPFPYGWLAKAASRKAPVHLGFIGSDWQQLKSRPAFALFKKSVKAARLITVPSETMRCDMTKAGYDAQRIEVLPHGVSLDTYRLLPNPRLEYDLIFVGRLVPVKRVDRILQALAYARTLGAPDLTLAVVGDGPEKTPLEKLAGQLSLSDRVTFAGAQEEVAPWLQRSRLFVMASENEGLPYALLEALACGLVPVVPRVGGIPEVIQHNETGMLYGNACVKEMAEYIIACAGDSQLYQRIKSTIEQQRTHWGYPCVMAAWKPLLQTYFLNR